jgi:gallate decarboxylase subunit D
MDGDAGMKWELTILNRPVICTVTPLDDGIHVLLTGGDKGHIGAVSVCDPDQVPETMTFPGHKEQYITAPWAKAIANAARQRCCVVCGIHYDNATPEEIKSIMTAADRLLHQVLDAL